MRPMATLGRTIVGCSWNASPLRRSRQRLAEARTNIDEQDLALFPRGEGDRALPRDPGAITRGQDEVAEGHLSLHEVEPRPSSLREFVDDVLPRVEQGRVDQDVLVDAQRSSPSIRRCDDTKPAAPFPRAEP